MASDTMAKFPWVGSANGFPIPIATPPGTRMQTCCLATINYFVRQSIPISMPKASIFFSLATAMRAHLSFPWANQMMHGYQSKQELPMVVGLMGCYPYVFIYHYLFIRLFIQCVFMHVPYLWNHQQCCWFLYVETCNFGETNPQYRVPEIACQVTHVLMT